jgi:class 3 adenylate cyclase
VISRVLSPVLVGRQQELSDLEDALLAANRGEGRFVLLGGEAGIGKTRLARELARRAEKLGCDVLWGSCSEAELPLPYLPFVEAIGGRLDEQDTDELRAELGPIVDELAQVFPQLGGVSAAGVSVDQAQAKVRLFESVVALLELWARTDTLLVVLDDIHWADSSTRELLEYVARRLATTRVMLLATYRSDELDRLHPLTRAVQTWRRGGLAETVSVEAMASAQAAEMIAAGLGADEVSDELADFIHERSEGNPFVLEEMLREAVDRGEIFQSDTGWERRPLGSFELPETVREAVLLRLGRLDPDHIEVLRAGAVLGRTFDYGLLVAVAEAEERCVLAALEAAVSQQLLEEDAEARDRYTWRHALTQEAIAGDTVLPKRLAAHSRAADALLAGGRNPLEVARHLLAAGRPEEALDACHRAAEEAERVAAFEEAIVLLERVLPHTQDPRDRATLLYRMGRLRWFNGEPAAAEQLLKEATEGLEELGLTLEAGESRVYLSRCYWELDRPQEAMASVEEARVALEQAGPSAQLALAYIRIAGLRAFELDYEGCREAAERAAAIAEEVGADFEHLWALTFVALGWFGSNREFELFAHCYRIANENNYRVVAGNLIHNELWSRVHSLAGGLDSVVDRYGDVQFHLWSSIGVEISKSWADLSAGRPRVALEDAMEALRRHEDLGNPKFVWRSNLAFAEALLELGRVDEAAELLPPPSPGGELQDVVYDTPARLGVALELGQFEEAAELGRRASSERGLVQIRATVALAVEGLIAGGAIDEAEAVLERAKQEDVELGRAGLDLAEGRLLLARGKPAEARPLFTRAKSALDETEMKLWGWRAITLEAEAAGDVGDTDAARELLTACIGEAHAAGAVRVRDRALAVMESLGLEAPVLAEPDAEVAAPSVLQAGERLVTSMFADVRGYTPIAATLSPEELADRMTTLHRWAAAEVGKRQGVVDKFAGDAVMATFNATGARLDHAMQALDAALALRDKAALMDLPLGIGIAVGPAVVSRSVDAGNLSVLGSTTNLAARLQTAAGGGDILLSDEAHRRVAAWLEERGLTAAPEELELKGFDGPQPAYRLASPVRA